MRLVHASTFYYYHDLPSHEFVNPLGINGCGVHIGHVCGRNPVCRTSMTTPAVPVISHRLGCEYPQVVGRRSSGAGLGSFSGAYFYSAKISPEPPGSAGVGVEWG